MEQMNFAIYFHPSEFRKPDLRVNIQGQTTNMLSGRERGGWGRT